MLFLSHRILPALQLTRMALVFTAIADSLCALLLWMENLRRVHAPHEHLLNVIPIPRVVAMMVISFGLYGFGMSLNDIIDRRRDSTIAAHRPLPSGRINVITAHVICVLLALMALAGGAFLTIAYFREWGWVSLLLVIVTGSLITFYDFVGKYLLWPGLLCLGLIRFTHACIAAPTMPLVWQPLLLLNHVTILSTIAYVWEGKRPPLTKSHYWGVAGGLIFLDLLILGVVALVRPLWIEKGLLLPLGAAIVFVLLVVLIRRTTSSERSAGQKAMLLGLLWLIVYDAAFVTGYIDWMFGLAILALLPVAYLSVLLMRWWGNLVALGQTPQFKRVE